MSDKKYWQSFGERNNSEAFQKSTENEFKEDLPLEGLDGKGLLDAKAPRRDFLKYLGFSTAAATLAASCEIPVKKVVPYLNKPENMVPGVADWYATTYNVGGDIVPVVAKVRDGRPIKLEGNEMSSITKGATSARVQAAVLDLYDTARLRFPVQIVDGKPQEVSTFEAFDKLVSDALAGAAGAPLVLLTGTITSPTTKQIISEFLAKYPGSRHVQYDADSYSGMLLANETTYGKKALPSYRFENAKVIVSLGADFLGTWGAHLEYSIGYAKNRKIDEKNPSMSKHYQFESLLSMTGANADDRYTHRPSEAGAVALALAAELGVGVTAPALDEKLKAGVKKAAKDLLENKGKALVVSGSNNPDIQVVVNAINEAIGAGGSTIDWSTPLQTRQGIDSEMNTLVADLNGGRVGALLIYGVNPVYDYYDGAGFKAALAKAKVSISFNDRLDETSELVKFVLPAPHFLESWGDTEAKPGHYSFIQPTISPLFKTRAFEDSLLKWSGSATTYEHYFTQYWTSKLGSVEAYEKALQEGVAEPATAAAAAGAAFSGAKLAEAAAAIGNTKKGAGFELVIYQKISMGTGAQANNPWLLELPDPVTKATWDNYAVVSPKFAKENWKDMDLADRRQADAYEVHPKKQLIKIKVGNKEITLPVVVVPGTDNNVIGVAVGFGRSSAKPENTADFIGKSVVGAGWNAFPLLSFNGTTVEWSAPIAGIEKPKDSFYDIAQTQMHNTYEERTQVVKEITLDQFVKHPEELQEEREKELKPFGGIENFDKEGTLYPMYDKPGIKWGMSIDMNACYGCGACVVACHAENNVSVVGKSEVLRYHDMHWIRIDRYFSGDLDDPNSIQTVFQPMLCQHCDNAPCENVCPVAATNHSSEGLNQMAYNRCIGTRYCANNCPYKVRRFNWADYTGADSFPNNQDQTTVGKLDPTVFQMNDDLTRMVLNPDVTVRSRGVMEKCSFCVQRLQEGKLKAKKENRQLKDMEDVRTACQQACSSDAIVFGNVNDHASLVSRTRKENAQRLFYVIEEVHTLPNVNYLAKVRHTDVIRGVKEELQAAEEKHA
ncbi:TAT-variant-translocated molybdopterin oxidoreductase [Flavitalea sp. BT771]|uniref:TAT-variant-translocated molybdopterin oxidoreductase n=1 Tax=Flavitalea sp. BT771 TaxID=3063329 RepID=UPI0026E47510|nr:TAT-variant-translocated molybdopterin oxidoreductase [Flavitalea sp. BT771]MDO6434408.1 TAT-variant-translocated molybdopterin oxidoreductase [Flavitalea sp. BT771]MDV6223308.1 TAT-variant-translocated molybdopterin oxidoreductase [Flavitalea sp. BT771]